MDCSRISLLRGSRFGEVFMIIATAPRGQTEDEV